MRVSGRLTRETAGECNNGKMALFTKGTGIKMWLMALAGSSTLMATSISESGSTTVLQAKVTFSL